MSGYFELHPEAEPCGNYIADRELPTEALASGLVIDTSRLEPGDLILTRPANGQAEDISKMIQNAQKLGGLVERHARWTHAAVYLGDGEHICEANFKITGWKSGVMIRSIHVYSDKKHIIRARRPKVKDHKQRIRIAIGALHNLGKGYSFREIFYFWRASRSGKGIFNGRDRRLRIPPKTLVCSTLYQDAFNFSGSGTMLRLGSLCTPAHLSASEDFEVDDPELGWLKIE